MIICVCKNVNEKTIKSLVDKNYNKKEIIKETGACTQCGICKKDLNKIMQGE